MLPLASHYCQRCILSGLPSKKTIPLFVLIEMEPIYENNRQGSARLDSFIVGMWLYP